MRRDWGRGNESKSESEGVRCERERVASRVSFWDPCDSCHQQWKKRSLDHRWNRIVMDTVYPPSPQWYQPHAACLCCLSEDTGWLLYSFNSLIHVMNPFTLKYQGMLQNGHTAKITAISSRSLTPKTTDHPSGDESIPAPTPSTDTADPVSTKMLVASGGEDFHIVCWDISSMQQVASLKKSHQVLVKELVPYITLLKEPRL